MLSLRASNLGRSLSALALSALLAPHAVAGGAVWIVDASAGPGFHFIDIQTAIDVAQPNDRVFVRAGTYSGFVLNKPLIVRGTTGTRVINQVIIQNIPAATRCTLSRLEFFELEVTGCAGGIVLEALKTRPFYADIGAPVRVQNSSDVRMHRCDFGSASLQAACPDSGLNGTNVDSAALEIVSSMLRGQDAETGFDYSCIGAGSGGVGLSATFSTVSIAHSDLRGGFGGYATLGAGGIGGTAALFSTSRARLTASTFVGGNGGWGETCLCGQAFGDGANGHGVRATSQSLVRHSGSTASGGNAGNCCPPGSSFAQSSNSQIMLASPARPTLALVNSSAAGAVTLRVTGPANTTARVWLGRTMVTPTPNTDVVGLLTNRARLQNLGAVPAAGQVDAFFTLPSSVDTGELVIAQADVLTSTGELLYSNSVCFTRP